jgi:hypothetical protein
MNTSPNTENRLYWEMERGMNMKIKGHQNESIVSFYKELSISISNSSFLKNKQTKTEWDTSVISTKYSKEHF